MTKTTTVSQVRQRRAGAEAGKPGQLDRFDDGSWEFSGNDETTPEDVAATIIRFEREKGNDEYKQTQAAALAQLLLESADNKKLRDKIGTNGRKAVPRSSVFVAEAPTLKQCVQMLMVHEDKLRKALLNQDKLQPSDKTLGTVRSAGLSLPFEE